MNKNITSETSQENQSASLNNAVDDNSSIALLLVDDEQNILSSLRRLFRPVGYKIHMATGGQQGLEILEKEKIDLIISDMKMPEMDGAEFLAKVAKQWPDTVRILLTGYADIESTISAVNEGKIYQYISKPWDDNDILISVRQALHQKYLEKERDRLLELTSKQKKVLQNLNANLENKVKSRTEEVRQTMGQLQVAHTSLKKNYVSTIKVFSNIIELSEGGDSSHTRNITDLAHKIAKKVGMSDDDAQQVIFASLLRNIGRIGLPNELVSKPLNNLDNEETKKVLKHPVIGQGILMALDYLQDAATIIRHQYELYDGSGYPDHLQGQNIPLGARIISLVSDYFAGQEGLLSSERLSASESREYIKRNSGIRYDQKLVDVLFELLGVTDSTISKQKKVGGVKISSLNLKDGMVLARDLVMYNGVILLTKGHKLTEDIIRRIIKMESSVQEDIIIYVVTP